MKCSMSFCCHSPPVIPTASKRGEYLVNPNSVSKPKNSNLLRFAELRMADDEIFTRTDTLVNVNLPRQHVLFFIFAYNVKFFCLGSGKIRPLAKRATAKFNVVVIQVEINKNNKKSNNKSLYYREVSRLAQAREEPKKSTTIRKERMEEKR